MSELTRLLSELVAIDSVNSDLVPDGRGEGELARFVAAWLERAGLQVELQPTAPGRPNVVGRVRGTGGGRTLMLNAHMDTVGLGGSDGGLVARVEGGRLFGRGAFDMKGSLAAIMLAAADLAAAPPAGDVLLTAVTDEEYASIGTAAIVRDYRADAAIITEPTDLETCIAHKGFVWAEIETRGLAAHGSQAEVGIDAIVRMGPILAGLAALDERFKTVQAHDRVGRPSVHASLISGGIELSTYPDRCHLQIERRTIPGETADGVERELRALVDDARGQFPDLHADVRLGIVREPFAIAPDAEIVQLVRGVAQSVTGQESPLSGAFGWMDSALLDAAGIPTVIFGPSGDGAHAETEWVDLASVEQCQTIYARVAREFCR